MNRAHRYACNYAVLRFLPYLETDEFVNLGVVVHCAETKFLGVKVETKRRRRATQFFPELDQRAFAGARAAIVTEMERVQKLVMHEADRELGRRVFRELVRPRETVFRFGELRTILASDPQEVTERLFEQYIDRRFAQQAEYQERVMADRYWEALQAFPLCHFHRNREVGTDRYHVRLPITSDRTGRNGSPQSAIKPLNLNRKNPSAVTQHGDAWTQRLRRLREVDALPEQMIFAVSRPTNARCLEAAREIEAELGKAGAAVVAASDEQTVLEMVTGIHEGSPLTE